MTRYRLGASTLGAPGESLESVIAACRGAGVRGIEMRAASDALVNVGLTRDLRARVRERLAAVGIEVFAIASGVAVAASGERGEHAVSALLGHLELARDLGARWVRVFPTAPCEPCAPDRVPTLVGDRDAIEADAAARLSQVAERAADLGVWPVLETHDSHPRGRDVARILERVDALAPGHRVGAIWDLLHPWRTGEAPTTTWRALAPWLLDGRGYVQIKDVASRTDPTPVLQGTGNVPLDEAVRLLDRAGYRGPISLEWERAWYPHIEPLTTALGAASAALQAPPSPEGASG